MSFQNCRCRCTCTFAALIAALVLGVITAFLQITAIIAVGAVLLWAALGLAVVYLGILLLASGLRGRTPDTVCKCSAVNTLLAGILGTVLTAVILLTVDIAAASIPGAILAGALVFFFTLIISGTACYVRVLTDCNDTCTME